MSSDTKIEKMRALLLVTINVQNIIKNTMNIQPIDKKCLHRNLHKSNKDSEIGKQILYGLHLSISR
jgi:hypothetical protein